jgi:hypothetical protein
MTDEFVKPRRERHKPENYPVKRRKIVARGVAQAWQACLANVRP